MRARFGLVSLLTVASACGGSSSPAGTPPPPPSKSPVLTLAVSNGPHTPTGLDWMELIGVANGEPFDVQVQPAETHTLAWAHAGDARAIVVAGRSDGTAIARGFASG